MTKKILFVCLANQRRSPTAERLMKVMAVEKGYTVYGENCSSDDCGFEISSAGAHPLCDNPITREDWNYYETIVALDGHVQLMLRRKFGDRKKVLNLGVPDCYHRDSPELVKKLRPLLEDLFK